MRKEHWLLTSLVTRFRICHKNKMKTILILDEVGQASIYKPVSYCDFLEDADSEIRVLLLTNVASEKDKKILTKAIYPSLIIYSRSV